MNINHFAYFIEAVRENSITKAAESLFISQSTISKAIKSLEQAYNTELIDRKARKFKLTSAGEIFYNSAVKIVSKIINQKRKSWLHYYIAIAENSR